MSSSITPSYSFSFSTLWSSLWFSVSLSAPDRPCWIWGLTSHPVAPLGGHKLAIKFDSRGSSRLTPGRADEEMRGNVPWRARGAAIGLGRGHGSKKGWGRGWTAVRGQNGGEKSIAQRAIVHCTPKRSCQLPQRCQGEAETIIMLNLFFHKADQKIAQSE